MIDCRADDLARGELSPIDRRATTNGPLLMVSHAMHGGGQSVHPYRTVEAAFRAAHEISLGLGYRAAEYEGPGSVAAQQPHRPSVEWGNLEDIQPQGPSAAEMRRIRAAGGLWAYQDVFRRAER